MPSFNPLRLFRKKKDKKTVDQPINHEHRPEDASDPSFVLLNAPPRPLSPIYEGEVTARKPSLRNKLFKKRSQRVVIVEPDPVPVDTVEEEDTHRSASPSAEQQQRISTDPTHLYYRSRSQSPDNEHNEHNEHNEEQPPQVVDLVTHSRSASPGDHVGEAISPETHMQYSDENEESVHVVATPPRRPESRQSQQSVQHQPGQIHVITRPESRQSQRSPQYHDQVHVIPPRPESRRSRTPSFSLKSTKSKPSVISLGDAARRPEPSTFNLSNILHPRSTSSPRPSPSVHSRTSSRTRNQYQPVFQVTSHDGVSKTVNASPGTPVKIGKYRIEVHEEPDSGPVYSDTGVRTARVVSPDRESARSGSIRSYQGRQGPMLRKPDIHLKPGDEYALPADGNFIIIVDDDIKLEIGNPETGIFVPFDEDYIAAQAAKRREPYEETYVIPPGKDVIFEDEDGNVVHRTGGSTGGPLKRTRSGSISGGSVHHSVSSQSPTRKRSPLRSELQDDGTWVVHV